MNYLIMGASAGLGRALARRLASEGNNLILLASDERDLHATASDLAIRHGVLVETLAADVSVHTGYLDDLEKVIDHLGGLDGLLCPIGAVAQDDCIPYGPGVVTRITQVNYLSVAAVTNRLWPRLVQQTHRTVIVGFGSVAAFRGRNANVAYAAAKRSLLSYFESLRHAASPTQVLVQFYILGYLDTNLAFGKRTLLPRANPERLACRVCSNLGSDFGVAYHPRFWRLIRPLLIHMPWFLYKRMKF
jgi:short-subunit dehydrogenase